MEKFIHTSTGHLVLDDPFTREGTKLRYTSSRFGGSTETVVITHMSLHEQARRFGFINPGGQYAQFIERKDQPVLWGDRDQFQLIKDSD